MEKTLAYYMEQAAYLEGAKEIAVDLTTGWNGGRTPRGPSWKNGINSVAQLASNHPGAKNDPGAISGVVQSLNLPADIAKAVVTEVTAIIQKRVASANQPLATAPKQA